MREELSARDIVEIVSRARGRATVRSLKTQLTKKYGLKLPPENFCG